MPAKKKAVPNNPLYLAALAIFSPGDKVGCIGDTSEAHAKVFGVSRYCAFGEGDECTVVSVNTNGTLTVRCDGATESAPFTSFMLIRKADDSIIELNDEYEAEILDNGKIATVGCQDIPFDAVEKLYNAMKSKQKPVVKKVAKKAARKR